MDRRELDNVFAPEQTDALIAAFSPQGHHHDIADVDDLQSELDALEPDDDEDGEEGDDEE